MQTPPTAESPSQLPDNGGVSRRDFLKSSLVAATTLPFFTAPNSFGKNQATAATPLPSKAKNVIFMVSDGMSMGVLGLAEVFLRMKTNRGTVWNHLLRERKCVCGLVHTASLDSLVTDSAAASSAWASGRRVHNGCINWLPDGTTLTPIGKIAKQNGKRFGLVTTATITHATPAGFAAVTPNRDDEFAIAPQYLNLVDILLGGGSYFFLPDTRPDKENLVSLFQQNQYLFVQNREQLLSVPPSTEKLLGLFASSHLPYRIDIEPNPFLRDRIPTLAQMTEVALRILRKAPEGFLLQVEGARIDHAAHHNDIATLLREQIEFDQAISVALEFAAESPDTLVIITTDHGNSNPGLNGIGTEYELSTQTFANVLNARESFFALKSWADGRLTRPEPLSPQELIQKIQSSLGLRISPEEAQALLPALHNEPVPSWNHQHANFWGLLGQIASNYNGVGWSGTTHTSDPVLVTALGPSCQNFSGFLENYQFFELLCQAFGWTAKS